MKDFIDSFSLHEKTVLITGGTRGIGKAISLQFARSGAQVLANFVRNEEAARALEEQAGNENLHIETCRADVTTTKGREVLGQALDRSFQGLSCFIHCAATGVHRKTLELNPRHFDWTFALNVRAFFEIVQMVSPSMKEGSTILAVSSQGAARAIPYYGVVGSSKAALESLARHLAVELAPQGIRVNILSPGSVITEAWDAFPEKEARIEEAVRRTPRGRLTSPDEVARAAQFLCSEASAGIVGHTLVVDGGSRIVG